MYSNNVLLLSPLECKLSKGRLNPLLYSQCLGNLCGFENVCGFLQHPHFFFSFCYGSMKMRPQTRFWKTLSCSAERVPEPDGMPSHMPFLGLFRFSTSHPPWDFSLFSTHIQHPIFHETLLIACHQGKYSVLRALHPVLCVTICFKTCHSVLTCLDH